MEVGSFRLSPRLNCSGETDNDCYLKASCAVKNNTKNMGSLAEFASSGHSMGKDNTPPHHGNEENEILQVHCKK